MGIIILSYHYEGYGKVIGDPASQARRFCSAHSASQNFDFAQDDRFGDRASLLLAKVKLSNAKHVDEELRRR